MTPYIAAAILAGLVIALLAAVVAHVGRRGESERDAAQQGPAERHQADRDLLGNVIPCHPGQHREWLKIGRRRWCGICGSEIRA